MDAACKTRLLERNQKLIDALLRRIDRDCPEAVAMVGICGSFCNGDFHERSDLDLMILIDDEAAWQVVECFVIGEVGFDFYCTTWEKLENDAKCGTPHLAKLLDTDIVWCRRPEAMERYTALREAARAILSAPFGPAVIERAEKEYKEAELAFSKLMRCGDDLLDCRNHAAGVLCYLENAVCILNQTYFKFGVKRIFKEFAAMRRVPDGFEAKLRALCDAETPDEMRSAARVLLCATDEVFEAARRETAKKEKPQPDSIRGTLEEMISNFRGKLWTAIDRGDTHAALSALWGLQSFFDDLAGELDMPRYDALSGYDPKDLRKTAEWYESAIRAFAAEYEKVGMKPNTFQTVEAFTAHYLAE